MKMLKNCQNCNWIDVGEHGAESERVDEVQWTSENVGGRNCEQRQRNDDIVQHRANHSKRQNHKDICNKESNSNIITIEFCFCFL